ncbi:TnsD family Tn7-like transposition protein [Caballeronia sp. LZ001]|uniref:TnsD family Tn7-like transposition protein n=1 Tax=Caballeronia sp. LZ001 TaxID=3038553 RepID=UPI0028659BDE|nr:TnsD family Tn7-like transposition protein [Caballeronia sp. LZ001]MDR5803761.1 TnsD family Tn7-like transposition protein [Caballeronia sp. LZ001]
MPQVEQISLMVPPFPKGQIINDYLVNLPRTDSGRRLVVTCKRLLERAPSLDSMPNGLREFHRVIGYLYDDLEGIARNHLAIEYYCCGLPSHKIADQFERVYGVLPGPTRLTRLPVLFGASEREYLSCPECNREQLREEGFTFIHRRTGAPFVDVCYLHACDLRPTSNQMFLFDQACREQRSRYQLTMGMEFAKRVGDCMEIPALQSPYRKCSVKEALRRSGWVRSGGRLHLSKLLSDFTSFYSGAFADLRLRHLTQTDSHIENALRNLMRETRAVHPIWCILLKWFTDGCEIKAERPQAVPLMKPAEPSKEELWALLQEHGSIARVATALSISAARVAVLCKRYGLHAAWRPKFIDGSLQEAISVALKGGDSPKAVQARFRVSLTTVYRILSSMPEPVEASKRAIADRTATAKKVWSSARTTNPVLPMSELRRRFPATWAQLYRQAQVWLKSHSDSKPTSRRNCKQSQTSSPVLARFAQVINIAEAACDDGEKRPLRKSLNRVRHLLGVSEYSFRSGRRRLAMSPHGECATNFVRRRVDWAVQHVSRVGKRNWALAKAAQLRQSTVNRVLKGAAED